MITRTTLGVAAATALLAGLGGYGAANAFAAAPPVERAPVTQNVDSRTQADNSHNKEAMVRHCADPLPAEDRAAARRQMEQMMSEAMVSDSMAGMGGLMMRDSAGDGHHGMR